MWGMLAAYGGRRRLLGSPWRWSHRKLCNNTMVVGHRVESPVQTGLLRRLCRQRWGSGKAGATPLHILAAVASWTVRSASFVCSSLPLVLLLCRHRVGLPYPPISSPISISTPSRVQHQHPPSLKSDPHIHASRVRLHYPRPSSPTSISTPLASQAARNPTVSLHHGFDLLCSTCHVIDRGVAWLADSIPVARGVPSLTEIKHLNLGLNRRLGDRA